VIVVNFKHDEKRAVLWPHRVDYLTLYASGVLSMAARVLKLGRHLRSASRLPGYKRTLHSKQNAQFYDRIAAVPGEGFLNFERGMIWCP